MSSPAADTETTKTTDKHNKAKIQASSSSLNFERRKALPGGVQ